MEHTSAILVWIAFLLYCGAFAMFLVALFARHEGLNRVGIWLVAGGWALQTVAIVIRGVDAGRVPVVGAYESLGSVAWSVATVYLVLELFTRVKTVGLYVTPVVIGLLIAALIEYEAPRGLMPALRSDIVTLHVIVMLTLSIVNKILHAPTMRMKEAAGRDECYLYVDAARTLFGLNGRETAPADAVPVDASPAHTVPDAASVDTCDLDDGDA